MPWIMARPSQLLGQVPPRDSLWVGDRGWGLFALKDFEPGDLITMYVGEEISANELRLRQATGRGQWVVRVGPETYLDGLRGGLLAQYINSPRGTSLPANARICCPAGSAGVCSVRARLHIRATHEILAGYGRAFFNAASQVPVAMADLVAASTATESTSFVRT